MGPKRNTHECVLIINSTEMHSQYTYCWTEKSKNEAEVSYKKMLVNKRETVFAWKLNLGFKETDREMTESLSIDSYSDSVCLMWTNVHIII